MFKNLILLLVFLLVFFCVLSILHASTTLLFESAYGHPMTKFTGFVMRIGEVLFSLVLAFGVAGKVEENL